jgi:putative membrane protein
MWHHHEGMGWWMVFGAIWVLVFWGAIIALIVWGVRKLLGDKKSSSNINKPRDPLEIAKERYARGEISREEFQQIKKDLS